MTATTHDELAGVVDLFGALTRAELERALSELAFKQARDVNGRDVEGAIEAALSAYALVETTHKDERVLLSGPAAFPSLPANATDLPHIMDVSPRTVDRTAVGETVHKQLLDAADADLTDERAATIREVSYDLETWALVDASDVRDRLDEG